MTCIGLTVIVRVEVVEGKVIVDGSNVVVYPLVNVVVTVVEGTYSEVYVRVGVLVTTTGGPALIEKFLIHANVKPSMITIQSPDHIELFGSSSSVTLLAKGQDHRQL